MLYMLQKDLMRFLQSLPQVYAKIKQVKGRLFFCLSRIWFIPTGGLLGILDGGVLPGSSNPDPISDQKM